jgi:Cysteine-rich secretory protein family
VNRMYGHLLLRLLALIMAGALLAALGVALARPAGASTAESAFVSRINTTRAAAGLPALRVSSDLTSYARSHSAAMMRAGTLYHTSTFSMICCWRSIAENIGSGSSVSSISSAFMASPTHRGNILDPSMRQVGVGVAVAANGMLWVTEVFRQPSGVVTTTTTTPTTTTRHRSSTATRTPARTPSVSRSRPAPDPMRLAVARLTARAAATGGSHDPVAQALGWSSTMRTLTTAR